MSNRPLMAVHMQQCSRADSLNLSKTSRLNRAFLASWSRRLVRLGPRFYREEIHCGAMGPGQPLQGRCGIGWWLGGAP